jgi:hypothetical protein
VTISARHKIFKKFLSSEPTPKIHSTKLVTKSKNISRFYGRASPLSHKQHFNNAIDEIVYSEMTSQALISHIAITPQSLISGTFFHAALESSHEDR